MMKNIKAVFMSVKPEGLLGDIKTANVLHHPMKAKNLNFNTYIYVLYYQSIIRLLFPHTIANFPDI